MVAHTQCIKLAAQSQVALCLLRALKKNAFKSLKSAVLFSRHAAAIRRPVIRTIAAAAAVVVVAVAVAVAVAAAVAGN